MPITTIGQKHALGVALRRYLNDVDPLSAKGDIPLIEFVLLSPSAQRTTLIPYLRGLRDERAAVSSALLASRASEDTQINIALADAASALAEIEKPS